MNFFVDRKERALMHLHREYKEAIEIILSDISEKGYSWLGKKFLRSIIGDSIKYRDFLRHVKQVFNVKDEGLSLLITLRRERKHE